MNIAAKIRKAVATRPFMLFEYIGRSILFVLNYLLWKVIPRSWLRLGENPHIASMSCFRAERPLAKIEVGSNFTAYWKSRITAWGRGHIKIGDGCSIGSKTTLDARERIEIGNHVLVSWEVSIADFDAHPIDFVERLREMDHSKAMLWPQFTRKAGRKPKTYEPVFNSKPIIIEDGVWICARAMILKGVRIGRGSIVAAGAVVTEDVPPYSIVAGNPARVVRSIGKKNA